MTFHYNNIGSTIVLTNEEGEAEEQYTYGPYGEILSAARPHIYTMACMAYLRMPMACITQAVEAAKKVYTNITNGEELTWKNAVDVITLGISVAGMGMAGASIAKSGKSLKAMYKGKKVVSNVAGMKRKKGYLPANFLLWLENVVRLQ